MVESHNIELVDRYDDDKYDENHYKKSKKADHAHYIVTSARLCSALDFRYTFK